MFLMYADESGDTGVTDSPTRYFVLTGLVIHELRWADYLDKLIEFRRRMKTAFGLRLRDEIHASEMLGRSTGRYNHIKKGERLAVIRALAKQIGEMSEFNIINVVVDKRNKNPDFDVFGKAWQALIQRFENTISRNGFRGPRNSDEKGLLFPDHCNDKQLAVLLRTMRRYNPVPNQQQFGQGYRNIALTKIVEDPNFRDSRNSYFTQTCDTAAYLLKQRILPSNYIKKKGAKGYFKLMDSALCKVASNSDPDGIVWL